MDNKHHQRSVTIAKAMDWQIEPYVHPTASWSTEETRIVDTPKGAHKEGIIHFPPNLCEFVRVVTQAGVVVNDIPLTPRDKENLDHEDYWALLPDFYEEKNLYLARRALAWGVDNEPFFVEWLLNSNHLLRIIVKQYGICDALDVLLHHIVISKGARADDL